MSGRKGVSPVVATVLLIGLVIILAIIIFAWSKSFISESVQKNGVSVDSVCDSVSFDVSYTIDPSSALLLQVVNRGSIPIYGFEIKFSKGSSSTQNSFDIPVDVGSSASQSVPLGYGADTEVVTLYPVLLGTVSGKPDNKVYTCLDSGKVINI